MIATQEIVGDIWNKWKEGFWIVIPTNGFVKNNGEAVMGAGLAKQAVIKFPNLPKELGDRLKEYGNMIFIFHKYRIITFPVKHKWMEMAVLELIEKSAKSLRDDIFKYNLMSILTPVYLPRVGCGNGKLGWKDVKKILENYLDDRFVICDLR